jgi:Tat protein translocase TatB subunit
MVVIFLVALVVLGPEKLPQVARTLGKVMSDFRRITGDFRSQIEEGMRDIERQTRLKEEAAAAVAATPAAPVAGTVPGSVPTSAPTLPPMSPGSSETAAGSSPGPGTPYDAAAGAAQEAATALSREDPAHENPTGENPIHEQLGGPVELPPVEVAPPDPKNPDDERYHST